MTTELPRLTLSQACHFQGRGLHSGVPVSVMVKPGEDGIAFWSGAMRTPAVPESVVETQRCTALRDVATIEHLMSALAGLGITDAEIEVSGPEMPAMDGSALPFVEGLFSAGTEQIGTLSVTGPYARVFHVDGSIKIAIAQGDGHWRYEYATGDRWPYEQAAEYRLENRTYTEQIAPARTFAMEEEIAMIRQAGLAKGLDETSALVIGQAGYVNKARYSDEPARHKLLDLIGDLALAGVPAAALGVVSSRSGHRTNVAAAAKLVSHVEIRRI